MQVGWEAPGRVGLGVTTGSPACRQRQRVRTEEDDLPTAEDPAGGCSRRSSRCLVPLLLPWRQRRC